MRCDPSPSPPESQALGIGTTGLGGGVLHPDNGVSSAMVSKVEGSVRGDVTSPLAKGAKRRSFFVRLGVVAAAVVAGLVVTGCGGSRAVVETRGFGERLAGAAAPLEAEAVAVKTGRVVRSVTTLGPGGRVTRETTTVE